MALMAFTVQVNKETNLSHQTWMDVFVQPHDDPSEVLKIQKTEIALEKSPAVGPL